jgi:flagellar FliL protein
MPIICLIDSLQKNVMARSDTASNAPPTMSATPRKAKIPQPEKLANPWLKLAGAALLLFATTGLTIWFLEIESAKFAHSKNRAEPVPPQVFLELEPISVNLQPQDDKRIAQVSFTLQMASQTQMHFLKQYTPAARSRLLYFLSTQKASEISTTEGQKKLAQDALRLLNQPSDSSGMRQEIANVFLTSIVIH